MVHADEVKKQLQRIGADKLFWGRAEMRELPHVLFEGEQLEHVTNGRYSGGFATLFSTNQRVLLIDKKPMYLTLEDVRYDMISDLMYNHRLLDATLLIGTVTKSISFTAYNPTRLRAMTNHIQERVLEFRQRHISPVATQAQDDHTLPVLSSKGIAAAIEAAKQSMPVNPYKTPVMIRRRVSRFY